VGWSLQRGAIRASWAKSNRADAAQASPSHKEQELRALVERYEAKVAKYEKELAEVLKQLAGLEEQMQGVRDVMLEP
jgi:chromosome segregation ATPase